MLELPSVIKIDDITSGRIDPEVIYKELDRLKEEINILRHDMSLFVKALATIPEGDSQYEYYRNVESRLKVVQHSIKEYYSQYTRLLPIINLAQIKVGHDVEILSANGSAEKRPSASNGPTIAARRGSGSKNKGTAIQPIVL